MRQVECWQDADWRLRTSQALVWGKLQGSCDLIDRRLRRRADAGLQARRDQLKQWALKAMVAPDLDVLRGIEGQAARIAFSGYAELFSDHTLRPSCRSKRPPRDPVNALLSFGYTLLTGELAAKIEIAGLDPGIGFYHDLKYGRDSLACDLIEEFRHLIERMVLGFFNRGQFSRADFTVEDDHGCRLKDDARKNFFRCYERALETDLIKGQSCRTLFERQVRELVSAVDEQRDYVPACCLRG